MRALLNLGVVTAAVLLTGCVSKYVSPVEVTRFTGDQPQLLGSGPIAVQPGPNIQPGSLEMAVFQDAVARKLHDLGYVVTSDANAQVAEVTVDRFVEQPGYGGNGSNVGVGVGAAGGDGWYGGSSVGVGVGIDLTPRPADRYNTELRVMIKPAAGGLALWEGRARFIATTNTPQAQPQAAADKLADALFAGFPGQSGETIEVE